MHPLITPLLHSTGPTLPIIIDEGGALDIISIYTQSNIASLDECKTGSFPGVVLYERNLEDEEKHLSIKEIRRWTEEIIERPYEGRALYILRDYDTATPQAMNASLKTLEEPAAHAIIVLVVSDPESLLETIRSRSISLFHRIYEPSRNPDITEMITRYHRGDVGPLIEMILGYKKIEINEALDILCALIPGAHTELLSKIEDAIITLFRVNESPRNILDSVILAPSKRPA